MENRRKTIVVNKQFQYQYSVLIAALCVLLVNLFIIFEMLFGQGLLNLSTQMALGIALVELVIVGGTWWVSMITTYRIAGPVYVFTREIARLAEGDLTAHASLRNGDMFQDEARSINDSMTTLRNRMHSIKSLAQQLEDSAGDNEAVRSQLLAEISIFVTEK